MNRLFAHIFILTAIASCKSTPPPDLSSQLKKDLSSRLLKIDSSAFIDSFKVMQVDTIVPRLGKIIDDTIYTRQLNSVREQLAHAKTRPRKDSTSKDLSSCSRVRRETIVRDGASGPSGCQSSDDDRLRGSQARR